MRQLRDNLGGASLDALRGVARSGLDTAELAGKALRTPTMGDALGLPSIADRFLGPSNSTVEDAASLAGPPMKTAAALGSKLAILAGPLALKAPMKAIGEAAQMAQAGKSEQETWRATGAQRHFPDQVPRWEIPDQNARLKPVPSTGEATGRLADFLDHPQLFENYPDLANVKVTVNKGGVEGGSFSELNNHMKVAGPESSHLSTMLHEVQHAVQEREGMLKGGSIERWKGIQKIAPDLWDAALSEKVAALSAERPKLAAEIDKYRLMGLNGTPAEKEEAARLAYTLLGGETEARIVEKRLLNHPAINQMRSPGEQAAMSGEPPPEAWLSHLLPMRSP
jgi:hypothetical protein